MARGALIAAAVVGLAFAAFAGGCAEPGSTFVGDLGSEADTPIDVTPEPPDAPVDPGARPPDPGLPPDPGPPDPGPDDPGAPDLPDDGLDEVDDVDDAEDIADPGSDVELPPPCPPCAGDETCGAQTCTSYDAEGSFCGEGCVEFGCTPASEGIATGCFTESPFGACPGIRRCQNGELTDCDGALPILEVCDGIDNDCGEGIDEGFSDIDGDKTADCVDDDDDGDTVLDVEDNCPTIANPGQEDLDGDDTGDVCDDDIDGDGVTNSFDCAPLDPSTSEPGQEVCNGWDDDCDGSTDEQDALGCKLWYPDADSDGFGGDGLAKCLCAAGDGFTTLVAGDCNDTTAAVGPLAVEQCDGLDNDCDSTTDPIDSEGCENWYFDGDGDGFYPPNAAALCLCGENFENQYSADAPGDCDDADPAKSPGAYEICDGVDDDCDEVADNGCDDDEDGYCDADMTFVAPGGAQECPLGDDDCDDTDPAVHPGAAEICDGKDSNCEPSDNQPEGTVDACGPDCEPCPSVPGGAEYVCTGAGPQGVCELTCEEGTFCEDCSCTGAQVGLYGGAVGDGKPIYDAALNTFRIGYFVGGSFRLRAVGPTGTPGNDVIAVSSVSKWTDWGLTQNSETGQFLFAWTSYPDSSVRIGFADITGTIAGQTIVAQDLAGALARQNVQIGWHDASATMLVLWDETTFQGDDIRGLLLDGLGAPLGETFQIAGGVGDQAGPNLASRGDAGWVFGYGTDVDGETPPRVRLTKPDGTGGSVFGIQPNGKAGTHPTIWYEPAFERGVVQWLADDDKYRRWVFGQFGTVGDEIDLTPPIGSVVGAPKSGVFRLFYFSAGQLRMRDLDPGTGALGPNVALLSDGIATKIVGTVAHPTGYSLVLWNSSGSLKGRLVAP